MRSGGTAIRTSTRPWALKGNIVDDAGPTWFIELGPHPILLPSVVLAGIMGMNFQMQFFQQTDNFWLVIGAMGVFALVIVAISRWRGWI